MAKEIERKFLVKGDAWRKLAEGVSYRQGYLNSQKERTVRIRTVGEKAYLTVKGPTKGVTRTEFEYEIPYDDCLAMLDELAEKPIVEKKRYRIPADPTFGRWMNSSASMRASFLPRSNCRRKTPLSISPNGSEKKFRATPATSIRASLRIPILPGRSRQNLGDHPHKSQRTSFFRTAILSLCKSVKEGFL